MDLIGVTALVNSLSSEPVHERNVKSYTMVEQLRTYIDVHVKPKYAQVEELSPLQLAGGPSGGKPIGFYLVGDDLSQLGEYMAVIMPELKNVK